MNTLSFGWSECTRLADELVKPINKVFVGFEHPAWGPTSVTLWRLGGTGLRIDSRMYDIAARLEVGVLQITPVSTPPTDNLNAAVDAAFAKEILAFKLTIEESGIRAESGIVLRADSHEIIVVAGAFPFCLAVSGPFTEPNTFHPEYPIDRYTRTLFA